MKYFVKINDPTIYYGHRGANGDWPGNTMGGFQFGDQMGVDGFELDISSTADGVLVLANKKDTHTMIKENYRGRTECDECQEALAQPNYVVGKSTYEQLKNYNFGRGEGLVKFEDFLKKYGNSGKSLAIELKQTGIAAGVVDLIKQNIKDLSKVTVTSFNYDALKEAREYDEDIRIGWLTDGCSEVEFEKLRAIKAQQICPRVIIEDGTVIEGKIFDALTPEKVEEAKRNGFEVRAWGIFSEKILEHARKCKVDGLTLNNPGKHRALLRRAEIRDDGRKNVKSIPRPRHGLEER